MTAWSIDPQGVVNVLTSVNTSAESFGTTVGSITSSLQSAVQYTQSGVIGEAVQSYVDLVDGPRLRGIGERIGAAGNGVVTATQAYVNGDLEMAAEAQRSAHVAIYPPPLPPGVM